jgi:hypothetical protein
LVLESLCSESLTLFLFSCLFGLYFGSTAHAGINSLGMRMNCKNCGGGIQQFSQSRVEVQFVASFFGHSKSEIHVKCGSFLARWAISRKWMFSQSKMGVLSASGCECVVKNSKQLNHANVARLASRYLLHQFTSFSSR